MVARRIVLLSLSVGLAGQFAAAQQDHKTWRDYGGGPDSSHFVALSQINKSNVDQLQVAWTYPTGDNVSYLFNPIIVDTVMYVLAKDSSLVAIDATSGKEIWIHENLRGIASRGISYWESKDRKDRRLIFAINNFLQEIDARTGKSILTFGNNGLVSLKEGLSRDPATIARIQSNTPGRVFENLILMGSATGEGYMSAPGDLRAYDVLTGKIVWTFHTIPQPGEFGYDTWPKGAHSYVGGANTWGEITVDEKRGIAYFPTGSSTYDFYGADRAGSNLFANCLLALDARTGKYLWHFQLVHHDLWDYDATAAPQLITVRHNGKQIDAVAQAGKNGFLFAFDRASGKPLWPIEERPVPKSDVPGEQTSPTQPFPTAPPPFARQKMTADDVNPYLLSPVERANLKDRIASAQSGLFTPPSLKLETVALPGARGGANWGGTAANAAKGLMYLVTQDWPTIYKLSLEDPLKGRVRPAAARAPGQQGRALYEERCQACHGPNGAGSALGPPKLAGVNTRLAFDAFRQVVLAGKAQMPAFPDVDNTALTAMFAFLSDPAGESPATRLKNGPVVASGGAPGGLEIAPRTANRYSPLDGPPYPPGLGTPPNRYFTNWGLYPDQPYVIGPPWSAIVAYDLNKGTIKWKMPLGEDTLAASQGAKDAGIIKGEHHGIIVTSTGLIFVNATDGKVRAYDEDNGKVLWTATLPAGSEGVPSMYEVNRQQYLVVSASSNITPGGGYGGPPAATASLRRGYVAFALPTKANASK